MFEVFKNDGKDVNNYWTLFIKKIDMKVEESLRLSVRKSLLEISKAINGEGSKSRDSTTEIHPLFKINVVLENLKVEFSPGLPQMQEIVNKVAREMISTISVVPRLPGSFDENNANRGMKLYDVIAKEDDILKIFIIIQKGMVIFCLLKD